MSRNKYIWALKRLLFEFYLFFCMATLIGGYLTGPVFTYCFFNDWKFWKYLNTGPRLFFYGLKFFSLLIRGENGGFMFSVPLNAPPSNVPDYKNIEFKIEWEHGYSCKNCNNCCVTNDVTCPIYEEETGLCRGYNSFFWQYFNCGRFPSKSSEIEYYQCPKWEMRS